jgi:hypothetical protein
MVRATRAMATATKRVMEMVTRAMATETKRVRASAARGMGTATKRAMLCKREYFGTYLGYLPMIPMSPQCDTFQLIPVNF